jgi:hypothetical protein
LDGTVGLPDGLPANDGGDSGVSPGDGDTDACVGLDASGDPTNCGACGHDCLGGGCEGGACRPITLATNEDVIALAIDATHVYWLNAAGGGGAERCPLAGCVKDAGTAWSVAPTPKALTLDTQYVYWTISGSPGRVERASKSGPLVDTIAPGQYSPADIVVDDTYAYWMAQGNLERANKDGGTVLAMGPSSVGPIALGNGTIFWVANAQIHSCSTPSCITVTDLTMTDQTNVRALASGDNFVYWLRNETIHRCAVAGCSQSPSVVGRATSLTLTALALDATDVYFGTDNGFVGRCSKGGCGVNPTLLAQGPGPVSAIAADGTAIYWATSGGGGGVRKLAR